MKRATTKQHEERVLLEALTRYVDNQPEPPWPNTVAFFRAFAAASPRGMDEIQSQVWALTADPEAAVEDHLLEYCLTALWNRIAAARPYRGAAALASDAMDRMLAGLLNRQDEWDYHLVMFVAESVPRLNVGWDVLAQLLLEHFPGFDAFWPATDGLGKQAE